MEVSWDMCLSLVVASLTLSQVIAVIVLSAEEADDASCSSVGRNMHLVKRCQPEMFVDRDQMGVRCQHHLQGFQ